MLGAGDPSATGMKTRRCWRWLPGPWLGEDWGSPSKGLECERLARPPMWSSWARCRGEGVGRDNMAQEKV